MDAAACALQRRRGKVVAPLSRLRGLRPTEEGQRELPLPLNGYELRLLLHMLFDVLTHLAVACVPRLGGLLQLHA